MRARSRAPPPACPRHACAQAGGRVCPRDDDHPRRLRRVLERIVDRGQAFGVGDGLQVVEHEYERLPKRRERVHQLVDGALDRAARDAQALERTAPEPLPHSIDGGRDVGPHPIRVVVAGVERDPGQRRVQVLAPGAHCGCLPVPGRGGDERQRLIAASIEQPSDPRPVDQATTKARGRQLRLGQRQRRLRVGRAAIAALFPSPAARCLGHRGHMLAEETVGVFRHAGSPVGHPWVLVTGRPPLPRGACWVAAAGGGQAGRVLAC
jgi:hypothetical protein